MSSTLAIIKNKGKLTRICKVLLLFNFSRCDHLIILALEYFTERFLISDELAS